MSEYKNAEMERRKREHGEPWQYDGEPTIWQEITAWLIALSVLLTLAGTVIYLWNY